MIKLPTWRAWGLIALIATLLGWLLAPDLPVDISVVKLRRDDWSLATLPRRFDQTAQAAAVFSAPFWGAVVATANGPASIEPPEDKRWRLAAVYGKANESGALIMFEALGKPPQRLRVGDSLPSGHRIESIGERDVCVRIGKKTYRLGVEQRD